MKRISLTVIALTAIMSASWGVNLERSKQMMVDDPYGIGINVMCMGVVFLCLALLFGFFKCFGYFADRQNKLKKVAETTPIKPIVQTGKKLNEVRHVTSNILQDGLETKGRDKEIYIAVIAMALKQYQDDVHDVESGVLTIKPRQSAWAAPAFNNI